MKKIQILLNFRENSFCLTLELICKNNTKGDRFHQLLLHRPHKKRRANSLKNNDRISKCINYGTRTCGGLRHWATGREGRQGPKKINMDLSIPVLLEDLSIVKSVFRVVSPLVRMCFSTPQPPTKFFVSKFPPTKVSITNLMHNS